MKPHALKTSNRKLNPSKRKLKKVKRKYPVNLKSLLIFAAVLTAFACLAQPIKAQQTQKNASEKDTVTVSKEFVGLANKALDELERGAFDVALFDLSMPLVSGIEALKLYRFTTPKPIPVLILSANVTTDAIDECHRAGAAEFISKPLRASLLLDAIERHLTLDTDRLPLRPPHGATDERPSLTVVDVPPLDPAVLEDLARLSSDQTFLERLLRGFRGDTERLTTQIAEALIQRKYELVKDAAHALKGGAASVGATQLTQIAIRLEKATHESLRIRAAQITEELNATAARTTAALEKHLEARRTRASPSA